MTITTETAMAEFVAREQELLWDEFDNAIRSAANGVWSMDASNKALRIVQAARLVGVTGWSASPWRLVASGVYEALCQVAGLLYTMPDTDEWPRLNELMGEYGGTRLAATARMAPTVSALRADAGWVTGTES